MSPLSSESTLGVSGTSSPPASPRVSDPTPKHANEKPPSLNADDHVPESQTAHSQVPTPPPSHHEGGNNGGEDDYSDALSADSQQQRQQRRHPRGGRKPKQQRPSAQHLQSVSEYEIPTSRRQAQSQEDEQDDLEGEHDEDAPGSPLLAPPEAGNQQDAYDDDALKKARGSRSKAQPRRPPARNRSTGIRSFSVQRPRGGGRKPPVAVSVERPGQKSEVKSKYDKRKQKAAQERDDCSSEEGSEDDEGETEKEEEPRKPVQIRLDLNLEIELLVKMKINGDITITFLE